MKQPSKDLTQGSLWKNIFVFCIPLMLSNVLQVLFNMSDIAVVGRFAGPLALGSVGSTAILVTMFTGFLIGLAGGINVLTALYLGAGKKQALSHTVHSALIVSICSGLALLLFGICFARPVLEISLECLPWLFITAVMLFSAQTVIQQGRYAICSLQAF